MLNVVKWLLVVIGGAIVIYAVLLFTGVFLSPVYLRYGLYPVIMLFAGIGIVCVSLGFFPVKKKD